jgi:NitT/TauT family transport system substrate-binding protein
MSLRDITIARAIFASAAAFFLGLATNAAAAEIPVKVTLDGSLDGASAPFLVAADRGYYRFAGLDVTVDAAGAPAQDVIARVASGAYDFGLADINSLIKYRDQNPASSMKAVFMVFNKPAYAIIARKSRGIAKPKDLEGKKLGAPASDPTNAQWPLFAKLNDIDISKVAIENVALPVREPILAAGQVDAVTGSSFTTFINLKDRGVPVDDLVLLPMANYGLQLYGDAIIVNPKFASDNPEAVKGFLQAFLRGMKETIRDPAHAIDSVVKRNDAAKKDLELERLRMAIRDNIVTPEVKANGLGGVDPARLANAIDQIGLTYKFKAPFDSATIFDPTFLPPPVERKVNEPQRQG